MASDQSFDPRFDPAFQRGFDADVTGPPVVERSAHVEVVDRAPKAPPVPLPLVESAAAPIMQDAPSSLRGNPWIPVLWVTAVVFTVAGVSAQYFAQTSNYSPTAATAAAEYVVPAVLSALSPWLFAVGLSTGIATLVIHALRWRPAD